jgi:dephospho-CoA kinase
MRPMFVLAVTGGIGAGKTMAARFFEARGAVVLDLDAIAGSLLGTPEVRDELAVAFGPGVLRPDGSVDREALAKAAFADDEATRTLDTIVHPVVLREVVTGLERLSLLERPPAVAVLDVPLLVEAPALVEAADVVLAIEAPEDVRIARCAARGMGEADARARAARQATDAQRAAIADEVIVNTGDAAEFQAALASFWDREVAAR